MDDLDVVMAVQDAAERGVVAATLALVGRLRGRGRASGIDIEGAGQSAVWTVRRGKVTRVVWFGSRDEAIATAV